MPLSNAIGTIAAYQFVRELTRDWKDTKAYKLGVIDADGKSIKDRKDLSSEEKDAATPFHRLVWNVKRLINKMPGGKSKIASYGTAALLLREDVDNKLINEIAVFVRQHDSSLYEEIANTVQGVEKIDKPIDKLHKRKYNTKMKDKKRNGIFSLKDVVEASKDSLYEEMQPEEIKIDANQSVNFLNSELGKMFPDQKIVAYVSENLGRHIVVGVYSVDKNAGKLDMMNAPSNAQFIMHLSDSMTNDVPMNKFVYDKIMIHGKDFAKIPYRKITGKSTMDASKKLLKWFKKNQEQFLMESLDEKKIKKVIRAGKLVKKVTCPEGQTVKNGKCVPVKSTEKISRKKAAKKRKRTMAGKSKASQLRKRAKSLRKRGSSGIK